MTFKHLFTPGKIGSLEIPNRFVQGSVQTRCADSEGFVRQELVDYHAARSHEGKGPGLVIAQQTFAWPAVKLAQGLALWDDKYIEKLAALASIIKKGGSRAVLQLGGSGSRLAGIEMAPSPVIGSWNMKRPREISREEMMHCLRCYAEAGRRLYEAGFEGFSLHGRAGKYIAQFLSPWSNRRTDEFGGSPENRVRYPLMIVDAIRERTRSDFPVIMGTFSHEGIEGGLSLEEGIEQISIMAERGVDAFLLASGGQESLYLECPPYPLPDIPGLDDITAVKRALPHVAVIANGGIHDPMDAEKILAEGRADFIGITRPLLADPDYVDKVRRNDLKSLRRCLRCNNCQTWASRPHLAGRGMCCTVNPALTVERAMEIRPAGQRKTVTIVGGGLAGMSAAATLGERGHRVILHEMTTELGGQWLAASAGEDKRHFRTFIPYLKKRMADAGVEVHLASNPDKSAVLADTPDAVVLATGAQPRPLRGAEILPDTRVRSLFAIDVLRGSPVPGKKAVVLGGRYIGIETALLLAERGHDVSLVEMTEIGRGLIIRIKQVLFRRLGASGIRLFPNSSLFRVTSRQVEVAHGNAVLPLDADALILAIGTEPVRTMQNKDFGVPVYRIGDCDHIGDAREAVAQGAELGVRL